MKKRILVVDDDKITLRMCDFILKKHDLEVVGMSTGQNCLDYLSDASNPPVDCIVLDIEMPLMNGFEVLANIRKIDRLKEIPVMFLTATTTQANVREAIRLGVTTYLRKPFLPKEFSAKVLKLLGD